MYYESSRCGKNAASVAGAKAGRKRGAKKKKPNTCQSVGFDDRPLGGRKNESELTLQREPLLLCSSRLSHVAPQLAQGVGFDLTDALG